jgi:hypothetical protein
MIWNLNQTPRQAVTVFGVFLAFLAGLVLIIII